MYQVPWSSNKDCGLSPGCPRFKSHKSDSHRVDYSGTAPTQGYNMTGWWPPDWLARCQYTVTGWDTASVEASDPCKHVMATRSLISTMFTTGTSNSPKNTKTQYKKIMFDNTKNRD